MGKHYDEEFKNMVLAEYKKGTFGGKILTARHFGIAESTLTHWIQKDRKQGNQINDIENKRGRKKEENIPINSIIFALFILFLLFFI